MVSRRVLSLQRGGRIERQGNENSKARIYNYVTKGSFDAYLYQTLEAKQRFIGQIMTSKSPARSCADVDAAALSYSEIKALCAGNPLIKEKMTLENEIAELKMVKSSFDNQQYSLQDKVLKEYPQKLNAAEKRIESVRADLKYLREKPEIVDENGKKQFEIKIGDTTYTEREAAGKALMNAIAKVSVGNDSTMKQIGEYKGFRLSASFNAWNKEFVGELMHDSAAYRLNFGTSATGNITRIENTLSNISSEVDKLISGIYHLKKLIADGEVEINKPFPQAEELHEKMERLSEVERQLTSKEDKSETVDSDERSQTDEREHREETVDESKALFSREIQHNYAEAAKTGATEPVPKEKDVI